MFSKAKILGSAHMLPLAGRVRRLAIEKLREVSVYRVRTSELQSLGVKEFLRGKQAFFVRGVAFNVMNGSWTVKLVGDLLYVGHDSLGPATLSLRCEPILALLDHAPRSIFVRAGIDG